MNITSLAIPDVKLIEPVFLRDGRGYFAETYHRQKFADAGIDIDFQRDNVSFSQRRGTIRGLHFQIPPSEQSKLVRVERGRIFDIAVDIRHGSASFGHHVAQELDDASGQQLLIPVGFAHGFCTLENDTVVTYKVSGEYRPEHDIGILWNDPALGITWPVSDPEVTLSARDRAQPLFTDLPVHFRFDKAR